MLNSLRKLVNAIHREPVTRQTFVRGTAEAVLMILGAVSLTEITTGCTSSPTTVPGTPTPVTVTYTPKPLDPAEIVEQTIEAIRATLTAEYDATVEMHIVKASVEAYVTSLTGTPVPSPSASVTASPSPTSVAAATETFTTTLTQTLTPTLGPTEAATLTEIITATATNIIATGTPTPSATPTKAELSIGTKSYSIDDLFSSPHALIRGHRGVTLLNPEEVVNQFDIDTLTTLIRGLLGFGDLDKLPGAHANAKYRAVIAAAPSYNGTQRILDQIGDGIDRIVKRQKHNISYGIQTDAGPVTGSGADAASYFTLNGNLSMPSAYNAVSLGQSDFQHPDWYALVTRLVKDILFNSRNVTDKGSDEQHLVLDADTLTMLQDSSLYDGLSKLLSNIPFAGYGLIAVHDNIEGACVITTKTEAGRRLTIVPQARNEVRIAQSVGRMIMGYETTNDRSGDYVIKSGGMATFQLP